MHTMPEEANSILNLKKKEKKKRQAVKTVEEGTNGMGYLFATLACKRSTI